MIQVFGTKKCRATQHCLRFFKERGIAIQFSDLAERAMSPGELDNCARGAGGMDALLDADSQAYAERALAHKLFDAREELLDCPRLIKTPVVRQGKTVSVGDDDAWKRMAASERA